MAVVRENILTAPIVSDPFLDAVVALDQTGSGIMASQVDAFLRANGVPVTMAGIEQELSVYDIFVVWHLVAAEWPTGNAAHGGPIFLPWHRLYMIRLEEALQQVSGNPDLALPYWDWASDGDLPAPTQWLAPLWSPELMGEARGEVRSGRMGEIRVRVAANPQTRQLVSMTPRRLRRNAGAAAADLPDSADMGVAASADLYDFPPWGFRSSSHRGLVEGFWPGSMRSEMHNRVHVWVGEDMLPMSSPNDPVFFLNHCMVDRIWQQWMDLNGPVYAPGAGQGPAAHRIDAVMLTLVGAALTPGDVLDPSQWYSYDVPPIV